MEHQSLLQQSQKVQQFGSVRKVNFLICGTQKGGTTALYNYLKLHPEIHLSEPKELHFFDTETYFKQPFIDYSTYHAKFSPQPWHKMIGEATPIYMYWYDAPRRIFEYNPYIKLIILLRNPIERAFSHWNMERARNAETLSFWEAIQTERERCRSALPYQHRVFSYVDRGFYLQQLRRIWTYFRHEQVLILKSEELKNNPQSVLQRVFTFLEVEPLKTIREQNVHVGSYEVQMSNKEREYLKYVFEYEIRGLERELQWDCNDWLKI